MHQYDAAIYDWQQAIDRDKTNADYVATQVDILIATNRHKEARKALDAAVKRGIPKSILNGMYVRIRN